MLCRALICACLAIAGPCPAVRADAPIYYAPGGIALSGYDVVAYYTEGRAVPGDADYALSWRGAIWYFTGPETLMAFEMNPDAYAPQFGGYCAYAVGEGHPGPSRPDAFFLRDGRLYFLDSRAMADQPAAALDAIVARAKAHWPAVLGD